MQLLNDVRQKATEFATANAAVLLTAGGVVGTVATGIVSWRGGYKTANKIGEENRDFFEEAQRNGESDSWTPMSTKDQAIRAIPYALPPLVIGGATIASIIMGHKVSAQKAAALAAAYGLAERNLSEYKEKVTEKLTGPKKQAIEDEIAQDRVNNTPGASQVIVLDGDVLCFDQSTGRYFRGSMEKINRALNSLNAEIQNHGHASAQYFYDELDLEETTWTKDVGWGNTGQLVELVITTTKSHDEKPCLAIDFNRLPIPDYIQDYG